MFRYISIILSFAILFSQGSGYLSQKSMVENNIRDRVKEVLSTVIDSHKYVINVDVELEILDGLNEQITVFTTRESKKRVVIKRMELALILQEGTVPELIENIRQLTMAASKFDRDRGDKLTIMTAIFKERRDQRSAEQIMLKNIAEKIDHLEQKRVKESSSWREDIETYKEEITERREQDLKLLEVQLEELDKKRLQEATEYEKKELARKDSIRNSKLETEIQALRDMLAVNESQEKEQAKQLDSNRFAMLDNELQTLRKMLLQAMLEDSVDQQREVQAQIEAELEEHANEKALRDSLIANKIAALDRVQADLDAMEVEAVSGNQFIQQLQAIADYNEAALPDRTIDLLAKSVYDAMRTGGFFGMGTDEEAVLSNIRLLNNHQSNINRFKSSIRKVLIEEGDSKKNWLQLVLSEYSSIPKEITDAMTITHKDPLSETVDLEQELEKLKGLLDKGFITQEQYDAKSNKLLGL